MNEQKPKRRSDFEFEWQETTEDILRGMKRNRIRSIPITADFSNTQQVKKAKEDKETKNDH